MSFPIILAVIIVVAFIAGSFLFLNKQNEQQKKKAMEKIKGQSGLGEPKLSKADQQNKRRAELSQKLRESKIQEDKEKKVTLSIALARAGLKISPKAFWINSVIFGLIFAVLIFLIGQSPFVVLMAAITGVFGLPRLFLKIKTGKRQKKFLEEFADALDAMVRLLKAGMPVSEAISMVSREFTGPVGEEMGKVYDQQKIGVALYEAAYEATRRMPLPEMQMFATGLAIQAQTGASLSEVLTNLANVIRARFRLKRKVKALSSEAIASASIIGALPNLVALGMYFANREYIMILFNEPFGRILLAGAVIWMMIGVFMMKIMINFKV